MSRIIRATAGVIAAQVPSGPTPILDFKFASNLTNDGSYGGSVSSNGTPTYSGGGAQFGASQFTNVTIAGSSTVLTNMAKFTFSCTFAGTGEGVLGAVYGAWSINVAANGELYVYFGTDDDAFGLQGGSHFGSGGPLLDGTSRAIKVTYESGSLKWIIGGTTLRTETGVTGDVLAIADTCYLGSNYVGTERITGVLDNVLLYNVIV
jgi:hypothetical protein